MVDMYYNFHLQENVTKTTVDCGKNFKTFLQFGTEVEWLPDIPDVAADLDVEGVEDVNLDVGPEAGNVDKVVYISVDASFGESSSLGLNLQVHMKCTAHTFNLTAIIDANKPLDNLQEGHIQGTAAVESICNVSQQYQMEHCLWLCWRTQQPAGEEKQCCRQGDDTAKAVDLHWIWCWLPDRACPGDV